MVAAGTPGIVAAGTAGTVAAGTPGNVAAGTAGTVAAGIAGTVAAETPGAVAVGIAGIITAGEATATGMVAVGMAGSVIGGGGGTDRALMAPGTLGTAGVAGENMTLSMEASAELSGFMCSDPTKLTFPNSVAAVLLPVGCVITAAVPVRVE